MQTVKINQEEVMAVLTIQEMLEKARSAQKIFEGFSQEQVDEVELLRQARRFLPGFFVMSSS